MRSSPPSTMEINLLPSESVVQKFRFSFSALVSGVLLILTVTFASLAWLNSGDDVRSGQQTDALDREMNDVQARVGQLQVQLEATRKAQSVVDGFGPQPELEPELRSLIAAAPSGTTLDTLNWDSSQITITGTAPSLSDVAKYEDQLSRSALLGSVWVGSVADAGSGKFNYSLSAAYKGGNGK